MDLDSEIKERTFLAKDGMLYLTGGSNSVSVLYSEEGFSKAVDSVAWRERFVERHRFAEGLKSVFLQLIVPEKLSVYPLCPEDMEVVFSPNHDLLERPGRRLLRTASHSQVIYPDNFLRDQTRRYQIFPKTDSHWTWTGAFSAFQVLMTKVELEPEYGSFVRLSKQQLRYPGDLWTPEIVEIKDERFERVLLPESVTRLYCNPLVGLKESQHLNDEPGLHVGSHCIFVNHASQFDKTVIIFGSSFSECRLEPSLLTAIFAHYFRVVHFIWSTSLDLDYIARHRPDLIVAEMPERFLTQCPRDDLNLEAFVAKKLQAWHENRAS